MNLQQRNSRGNAIIEMALTLPTLLGLVSGLVFLLYYLFAAKSIQMHLHEAMICSEEQQYARTKFSHPESICQDHLTESIQKWLPFGKMVQLQIKVRHHAIYGRLRFELTEKTTIEEIQTLSRPVLPL